MSPGTGDPGRQRPRFFGRLPSTGLWTAVGLSRLEFLLILGISVALFSFVGGPFWLANDGDLLRMSVSYGAIPLMILVLHGYRGGLDVPALFGASVVIGLIKLVVTALLVLSLSL